MLLMFSSWIGRRAEEYVRRTRVVMMQNVGLLHLIVVLDSTFTYIERLERKRGCLLSLYRPRSGLNTLTRTDLCT